MRPLALIETDPHRAAELRAALDGAGFRTEWFTRATDALQHLRTRPYALLVLGLDVRDTDPYAFCREISPQLPVITISETCGGSDRCVHALECGADDCVTRTTSGRELVARIRSVLRRAGDAENERSASVSLSEMRVRTGETTHDLTRGETELLTVLLQYAPTPVPIARLTALLGARRGTVESRIKSLRRKLGPGRLVSRGSLGYQWMGE